MTDASHHYPFPVAQLSGSGIPETRYIVPESELDRVVKLIAWQANNCPDCGGLGSVSTAPVGSENDYDEIPCQRCAPIRALLAEWRQDRAALARLKGESRD